MDGSHVGALKGAHVGPSPVGRARPGSRHHLIVDHHGTPLVVTLTGGNRARLRLAAPAQTTPHLLRTTRRPPPGPARTRLQPHLLPPPAHLIQRRAVRRAMVPPQRCVFVAGPRSFRARVAGPAEVNWPTARRARPGRRPPRNLGAPARCLGPASRPGPRHRREPGRRSRSVARTRSITVLRQPDSDFRGEGSQRVAARPRAPSAPAPKVPAAPPRVTR